MQLGFDPYNGRPSLNRVSDSRSRIVRIRDWCYRIRHVVRAAHALAHVMLLVAGCCGMAVACRGRDSTGSASGARPPTETREPGVPATGAPTMAHGNHDPRYGGTVLMNGDLHFEVVLKADGRHGVYFSDAMREELPASIASEVTITLTRPGAPPEPVTLHIDDAGESWAGSGRPVAEAGATARIAYTVRGKPYWIDLPFSAASSPW